ncbi:hypothetical protein SAMN05216551_103173 [Chitinasiproducens palmae]|uniref:Uncharacterized protein n=1 Tax=Chitinasiproducens palmae TaxID=1770053 RepID=A0A1H2PM38_9BURK|nr:hypothetical protein SAMN05216551_103173 [Chitinasiproducens palmae]
MRYGSQPINTEPRVARRLDRDAVTWPAPRLRAEHAWAWPAASGVRRAVAHTILVAATLLGMVGMAATPAQAQLHGRWPDGPHRGASESLRPDGEREAGRRAEANVPRGDLRADIANNSRNASYRPGR